MIRRTIFCLFATAALAACSGKPAAADDEQAEAAVAKVEASPSGKVPRGLPVTERAAKASPTALPPAFEGRWGLTPADCDIARSDTRGVLVVRGSTLTFYDSSATATLVGGPSRYKVVADLAYKSGGRQWMARETLELASAGTHLLRTSQSPAKTYRYERC